MFGFSKSSTNSIEQNIFFHEDCSAKDVSEALVGRKGYSLFQLRDMDVPVPSFFVISPRSYKKFLLNAFDNKLADLMNKVKSPDVIELEKLILKAEFDQDFMEELHRAYSRLSGFSDAWVGVRSSVVYPQREDVSFSGLFSTELNVKGFDHLVNSVKHVYLSVFKNRVVVYARESKIDISDLQMAIVVQKMVQPEVSGVAYTLDPVTNDKTRMSVEAVFGLGDVIADGSITPDQYMIEKKELTIAEKHIAPQEWMKIRKPGKTEKGSMEELQKIQISKAWSHQQKLEDTNIKEVAKVALIVEDRSKHGQAIEWVWESGNVWILQSKPILSEEEKLNMKENLEKKLKDEAEKELKDSVSADTSQAVKASDVADNSVFDVAIDILKEEKLKDASVVAASLAKQSIHKANESVAETDRDELVTRKKSDEKDVKALNKLSGRLHKITTKKSAVDSKARAELEAQQIKQLAELGIISENENRKLEFLLTGIGSSYGSVAGVVKVLTTPVPEDLIVTKQTILLIKNFSQEMEKYVILAGGVLMDEGGLTSDASILCRENQIPAVVGTGLATALLKEDDVVKIDGNVGSVYRVSLPDAPDPNNAEVTTAVDSSHIEQESIYSAADRARESAMRDAAEQAAKKSVSPSNTKDLHLDDKLITATKVMFSPEGVSAVTRYDSIINQVDGICYIDLDELMLSDKRHPLAYVEDKKFKEYAKNLEVFLDQYTDAANGEEVIVSIGSATVSRFRSLVKGTTYENKEASDSMYGAQRYLQNPELLARTLSIIKRVRNVYKSRNLSLAIHSPMNGESMKAMKKEISSIGLKRTGTFNVYAVIDNPAEIILSSDILEAGIDGLILNTPRLARQMQGLPMYGDQAKYDIGVPSVMKILENSINQIRGTKYRVLVVAEDSETLIKKSVVWGAYAVIVSPDYFKKAKKIVSDEEARMVMSIGIVTV